MKFALLACWQHKEIVQATETTRQQGHIWDRGASIWAACDVFLSNNVDARSTAVGAHVGPGGYGASVCRMKILFKYQIRYTFAQQRAETFVGLEGTWVHLRVVGLEATWVFLRVVGLKATWVYFKGCVEDGYSLRCA